MEARRAEGLRERLVQALEGKSLAQKLHACRAYMLGGGLDDQAALAHAARWYKIATHEKGDLAHACVAAFHWAQGLRKLGRAADARGKYLLCVQHAEACGASDRSRCAQLRECSEHAASASVAVAQIEAGAQPVATGGARLPAHALPSSARAPAAARVPWRSAGGDASDVIDLSSDGEAARAPARAAGCHASAAIELSSDSEEEEAHPLTRVEPSARAPRPQQPPACAALPPTAQRGTQFGAARRPSAAASAPVFRQPTISSMLALPAGDGRPRAAAGQSRPHGGWPRAEKVARGAAHRQAVGGKRALSHCTAPNARWTAELRAGRPDGARHGPSAAKRPRASAPPARDISHLHEPIALPQPTWGSLDADPGPVDIAPRERPASSGAGEESAAGLEGRPFAPRAGGASARAAQLLAEEEQDKEEQQHAWQDGHNCSICLDLYFQPERLACGHAFCSLCLSKCKGRTDKLQCPLCRQWDSTPPVPDHELGAEIARCYPQQLAARARSLESEQQAQEKRKSRRELYARMCNVPAADLLDGSCLADVKAQLEKLNDDLIMCRCPARYVCVIRSNRVSARAATCPRRGPSAFSRAPRLRSCRLIRRAPPCRLALPRACAPAMAPLSTSRNSSSAR